MRDLKISKLLLSKDANYLWLILVPRKNNLTELTHLEFEQQIEVLHEINLVSKMLEQNFGAEKLNIAALGNVVSQLHIHVILRKKTDATFPKPIWGNAVAKFYKNGEAEKLILKINKILDE